MTSGWVEQNNSLYRKFEFSTFREAFAFMTKVAELAEEQDHHPDWSNCWNKVDIRLSTHDAGNVITQKDIDLAEYRSKSFYKKSTNTEQGLQIDLVLERNDSLGGCMASEELTGVTYPDLPAAPAR